jgi:Na+/proline symporter
MQLLDWIIIGAYFVLSAGIGLAYAKRAGESVSEFFVSGRSLPWWLAGTSMVATTFAADTPLAVTGMVAANGVAGNWLWWNMVMSGILTVFFYAHLWRRAEVLTDVEFAEIRYSGKPAAVLRVFRALYMALPINLIIMGWVNLAMIKILDVVLGVDPLQAFLVMFVITMLYSVLSGLWGVVVTDFVQFVIAMGGSITLAIYAVNRVGGIDELKARLPEHFGSTDAALSLFPRSGPAGCRSRHSWPISRCSGGRPPIPAPSRAAAATSRNASSAPKPNAMACSPRSGSTSRTTPCGRGRGF